jgi:hypothetical protein
MMLLSAPPPIVPALVVVFFAAGTGFGVFLARRAIIERPAVRAHALDTDLLHARREIESLDPGGALERTYGRLARALERYLDARFALSSEEMSGADIESAIVRAGATRPAARAAAQLLERCRVASSGATSVTPERVREDIAAAREITRALDSIED